MGKDIILCLHPSYHPFILICNCSSSRRFQSLQPLRPVATTGAPDPDADPSDSDSSDSGEESWEDVYKRERDEARKELEKISKEYGIAQFEWEDQRKQFCDAITGMILLIICQSL